MYQAGEVHAHSLLSMLVVKMNLNNQVEGHSSKPLPQRRCCHRQWGTYNLLFVPLIKDGMKYKVSGLPGGELGLVEGLMRCRFH